MKQLLILSGKGGTGKTTLASAFIKLSGARAYADCDVDAPNLHLITGWTAEPKRSDYYGLPVAEIDPDLCTGCDLCRQHCRFDSIESGETYRVLAFSCEGCGVCEYVCPAGAARMARQTSGELMLYRDEERVFSTARLKMGSGTSGLLVSEVKANMKEEAEDAPFAIIDGSPGIGCPVIASLSGVDMVLIVAEPSVSGISDMERIIRTAGTFGVQTAVCINKSNTNAVNAEKIKTFCKERGLPFVGEIPFDPCAVEAINDGKTIVDIDCISGVAAKGVYEQTMKLLFKEEGSKHYERKLQSEL